MPQSKTPDNDTNPIYNLITDNLINTTVTTSSLSRRRFLQTTGLTGLASLSLIGCGGGSNRDTANSGSNVTNTYLYDANAATKLAFLHGVASGDPLADRVIIWTRITPVVSGSPVTVQWQMAKDKGFTQLIKQGTTTTDGGRDYTVKVDVIGLQANTRYFYRFIADGVTSPVGTTKTLPTGTVNQVKLAVASCSNYPAGYFHVYADIAKRSDIDALVYLGDYIYEYGRTYTRPDGRIVPAYGAIEAQKINREVLPAEEVTNITAYRLRYAQHRTDKDLQALHAAMPIIAVWDDHEFSNEAYKDGAENHQANEGTWNDRKLAAMKAYHEWMPTRNSVVNQIYRSFNFGSLISLHMLDTRMIARDKQLNYNDFLGKDATGQLTLDNTRLTTALANSSRQMIGLAQQNWLFTQLQASKATWQILGQQVLMGKMHIPSPVLLNFRNPSTGVSAVTYLTLMQKAQQVPTTLTAQEKAILAAPSIPYNLDAWDGYAVAREAIFTMSKNLQKNLVVLAGDTHNAWANNLVNANNEAIGVEFATSSVTSPGLEYYLPNVSPQQLAKGMPMLVKSGTLKWCDPSQRGYMILTVTPSSCRSDWVFVSDILQPTYSSTIGKSMQVNVGQRKLA